MADARNSIRLSGIYVLATLCFYFISVIAGAVYLSFFSGDTSGVGTGFLIALPIMLVVNSVVYFFVPGSTLVAVYLLANFILKLGGSKITSTLLSVAAAAAIWLATFPVAVSLINVVYAGNSFLMLQESSWFFIYLLGATNFAGLIFAVLWVKLRPAKNI